MKQGAFSYMKEAAERDEALDLLERARVDLVSIARVVATDIHARTSRVTSTEVVAEMRARGYGEAMDAVDPRWLGALFRKGSGWKRIGWEPTGSHCRPVAVWTR